MNKKISTLAFEHQYERSAFAALAVILGFVICGYLYFVGASVLNIIERKEASSEIERLHSSIAMLEQEYFALQSRVTPLAAHDMGLTAVTDTDYIHRPGNAAINMTAPDAI